MAIVAQRTVAIALTFRRATSGQIVIAAVALIALEADDIGHANAFAHFTRASADKINGSKRIAVAFYNTPKNNLKISENEAGLRTRAIPCKSTSIVARSAYAAVGIVCIVKTLEALPSRVITISRRIQINVSRAKTAFATDAGSRVSKEAVRAKLTLIPTVTLRTVGASKAREIKPRARQ